MNQHDPSSFFFRRSTRVIGTLGLTILAAVFLLSTSAKTDDVEQPVVQDNLVNGRLAFNHLVAGPGPDRNVVITLADGSTVGGIPTGETWPQNPTWAPDGTTLAYTSTRFLNSDIWTSGGVNLTNTADISEDHASWSVLGKIAYERAGAIWTMNADGSGQAMFVAGERPAWSPDGSKLAYSNGNVWYINADGSGATLVANGASNPTWSPDGLKLAFSRSSGISTINLNGTGESPILATSGTDPAWSPDGTTIAYSGPSGLWIMSPDGSNKVRIYTDVINFPLCCDHHYRNPAWQPVGQTPNTFIIYGRVVDNNNASVSGVTVDLSGTSNATTTTDGVGNYQFSGLAPGGNYTVSPAALNRTFAPAQRSFANLDGIKLANFTMSRVCAGLVCAQNGKIAFGKAGEIFTINLDGTGATNITNNPASDFGPDWSPDGNGLIFYSNRDGNNEIYRKASETATPVRLTKNTASDFSPRFSADGASIVFMSDRDGGNWEIYKMNADGSNQVRLTNTTEFEGGPVFSPDGLKILFVRQASGFRLFTINADGSNEQPLFGPANFLTSFSYSPDGTKILLVYGTDVTQQTIYTMNANGTGLTQSGIGRSQPAWSPDGTKVVHNCCFFQGPQFANGFFISNLAGPLGPRLTTDGSNNESSPDWQPLPAPRRTAFDFDGDGRSDLSYFRGSNSGWYLLRSTDGLWVPQWGLASDVLVPGDYDGDLKTDLAVWRESTTDFYVLNSSDFSVRIEDFGLAGDVPTGGDFDGDGKTDVAVYRPGAQSVLYYRASMGNPQRNVTFAPWGVTGDKPVVGDYDGDGRSDAAVYRPSNATWYVRNSSNGQMFAVNFGIASDTPVPADYDSDGRTDPAVYRSGVWYLLRSTQGFAAFQFGIASDVPAPADYDGDGKADPTIFRDGSWWSMRSKTGAVEVQGFGTVGDKPIPSVYLR